MLTWTLGYMCLYFNSGFLDVYAQQWDCWVLWLFYFQFLKDFKVFKGISTLFSIVAVLVCIPTNSVRGLPFLHTLSSIYCLYSFKWTRIKFFLSIQYTLNISVNKMPNTSKNSRKSKKFLSSKVLFILTSLFSIILS